MTEEERKEEQCREAQERVFRMVEACKESPGNFMTCMQHAVNLSAALTAFLRGTGYRATFLRFANIHLELLSATKEFLEQGHDPFRTVAMLNAETREMATAISAISDMVAGDEKRIAAEVEEEMAKFNVELAAILGGSHVPNPD